MSVEIVDGLALHPSGPVDAPALVLLHGFTGSAEAWPSRSIVRLETVRRVVRVDLPGHGQATVDPSNRDAWGPERTIERLRAVAEVVGEGARWLGYSMGGRLALLAHLAGVPMRTLLLESASPGLPDPSDRAARRASDAVRATRLETAALADFVDAWMALPLFASQARLPAEVRSAERDRRLKCDPQGLAAALRGFGTGSQPSLWDRLDETRGEVRILTGDLDEKFSEIGARMTSRIPRAEQVGVPAVGHAVHLEAPDRWVDWILER